MTGRSAQYGQACLACVRIKCRCVPRASGDGCERCHRLKRTCQTADALRRRSDKGHQASSQTASDARIARLEGTLGQLASLLQANHIPLGEGPGLPPQEQAPRDMSSRSPLIATPSSLPGQGGAADDSTPDEVGKSGGSSDRQMATYDALLFGGDDDDDDLGSAMDAAASWRGVRESQPVHVVSSSSPALSSKTSVPPATAAAALDVFKRHKLHHCAFVHLPAHVTAEQLQQERPLLFSAIVCAAAAASTAEKRARALELKRMLFEAALLQPSAQPTPLHALRRKLDLLTSLLTYIAWGWDHIHSGGSPSRLMMLAIALANELCLAQASTGPKPAVCLFDKVVGEWHGGGTTSDPADPWSGDAQLRLECQRAILGCFLLGSAVSAYFLQVDPPRWLPQMDKCLSAVTINSAHPDCLSDGILSFQVRLQLLSMKAVQACERCQLPDQPPAPVLPAPVLMYIKTLMVQLQDLRASIPPAFQHNVFPLVHTYFTEFCIIETVHAQEIAGTPPPTSGGPPARLWHFWQSALAMKSCTSTFLTLSPAEFLGVSIIQWAQLARCIATLHSFCTLSDLGWDLTAVWRLVDLPSLLASTAEKLELASAEAGEQPSDGIFAQLASGMRAFQAACAESHQGQGQGQCHGQSQIQVGTDAGAEGADAHADAMMQQEDYLLNPTQWLDRLLKSHDEQTVPPT